MLLINHLSRNAESAAEEALKKQLSGMSDEEKFSYAEFNEAEGEKTGYSNYSYWGSTIRVFFKNPVAVTFLVIMLAVLLFTFIQPYLPNQYDPNTINADENFIQYRNVAPNSTFWFGTNSIGQDLWARIWSGTRTSLFIGFAVALIDAFIGIIMGVLWGYVRKLDFILTELYNVLDNIPQTIILILLSYIMKPGVKTLIFAMCVTGWIGMARFIRNQIVIIRDRDYNLVSRCLGTPTGKTILKNLLPYLVSVIMLRVALSIPGAIGSEVFVTYIGLGLPIDVPSLGSLINDGRAVMMNATQRYQLIFPVLITSVITISFYIIGNAFSDAADPKNHR